MRFHRARARKPAFGRSVIDSLMGGEHRIDNLNLMGSKGRMSNKVQCAYCRELIDRHATKCPHCREKQPLDWVGGIIGIGVILGLVILYYLGLAAVAFIITYWVETLVVGSIAIGLWAWKPKLMNLLVGLGITLGIWWVIAVALASAVEGMESLNFITEHSLWKEYKLDYAHWVIFFLPFILIPILITPFVLFGAFSLSRKGKSEDKKSTPSG